MTGMAGGRASSTCRMPTTVTSKLPYLACHTIKLPWPTGFSFPVEPDLPSPLRSNWAISSLCECCTMRLDRFILRKYFKSRTFHACGWPSPSCSVTWLGNTTQRVKLIKNQYLSESVLSWKGNTSRLPRRFVLDASRAFNQSKCRAPEAEAWDWLGKAWMQSPWQRWWLSVETYPSPSRPATLLTHSRFPVLIVFYVVKLFSFFPGVTLRIEFHKMGPKIFRNE
jgi:hypothetical protein